MKLKIKGTSGNDLFAEQVACVCSNEMFIGTNIEDLMKHKIRLRGYNDINFFDNVNKKPRSGKCKCGRKYTHQWFRTHVDFKWEI